jgi:hypothetical protein
MKNFAVLAMLVAGLGVLAGCSTPNATGSDRVTAQASVNFPSNQSPSNRATSVNAGEYFRTNIDAAGAARGLYANSCPRSRRLFNLYMITNVSYKFSNGQVGDKKRNYYSGTCLYR